MEFDPCVGNDPSIAGAVGRSAVKQALTLFSYSKRKAVSTTKTTKSKYTFCQYSGLGNRKTGNRKTDNYGNFEEKQSFKIDDAIPMTLHRSSKTGQKSGFLSDWLNFKHVMTHH